MKNKILAITRDIVPYVKQLRQIPEIRTASAAILMQQLDYWFSKAKNGTFYKFLQPCEKDEYKAGDSWCEELGFDSEEFRSAFDMIGVRYKSAKEYNAAKVEGDAFKNMFYLSYTDRIKGLTFYLRNDNVVDSVLDALQEGRLKEIYDLSTTQIGFANLRKYVRHISVNTHNQSTEICNTNTDTYNTENTTDTTSNKEVEKTPPSIESEFVDFEVVEKEKFVFDDDVPFSGDGMVDFLKWQREKQKAEIENKANNLPLEEKKEKEKNSAKKEKKEKPQLKTMIESYPDEESFVIAWGLRFGAKYPKVDASKGYNRILLYCETSGKLYADYVRVLFVWYTGENENKRKSYEYDERTKQSNYDILANMVANMDNSNSDVF